jgi:hypothetical protein
VAQMLELDRPDLVHLCTPPRRRTRRTRCVAWRPEPGC